MSNKELCLQGGSHEIREGTLPNIFVYKGYRYDLEDTDSLIAFATKYSSEENGVILHDESGIGCLIDATVEDRPQDFVQYKYEPSFVAEGWGGVLFGNAQRFSIKEMAYFLEHRNPDELERGFLDDLIDSVKHMKYVVTTEVDQTYGDRNNFTAAIKVGEHPGNVKIPRKMYPSIELIGNDPIHPIAGLIDIFTPTAVGHFTAGIQASWRFLTFGVEMRGATARRSAVRPSEERSSVGELELVKKDKVRLSSTRVNFGFRF